MADLVDKVHDAIISVDAGYNIISLHKALIIFTILNSRK